MSYCPMCKHQFEDDMKECPHDKTELVDELSYQTVEGNGGAWVELASVSTQGEARLIQGFLEAEGIVSQIESLKFTMEPVNLGAMSEIRIFVDAENETEAAELLENRREEFAALVSNESVVTDEGPAMIEDDTDTDDTDESDPSR